MNSIPGNYGATLAAGPRPRADRMSNCVGSSGVGPPASAVAQHGVERGDHLAHDGDKDDLGLLAGGGEAVVECFEGGVVTAGAEGCHVEDVSDRHASAVDAAVIPAACRCRNRRA